MSGGFAMFAGYCIALAVVEAVIWWYGREKR